MTARHLVRALPASAYLDPAVWAEEREKIFFRTWQYAAHASQLVEPGAFVCFDVLDQSLFVVRGRDGVLRGFHNVCQHRAHRLVSGCGRKGTISCPYHAWTYDLDGRLKRAPNDERTPGFERAEIRLAEVKVEEFLGFVFVNLDPDAAPMDEWYPRVREEIAAFVPDLDRLAPAREVVAPERCNWKVSVENYSECYHCALVHRAFTKGVIDPNSYDIQPQGHCLRHTTRAAQADAMSYAVDRERNPHADDYSSWFLWPAFSFQVYPGGVLNTYLWRARAVDQVDVIRGWYALDGVDSEALAGLAEQDRATTVAEDVALVESVQAGLSSIGYRPGPLVIDPDGGVNSEHSIAALYAWREAALNREPGS